MIRYPAPCFKIIPLAYEESLSYYEQVNQLIVKINEIIESYSKMETTANSNTDAVKELQASVKEMEYALKAIENGEATKLYEESLENYINKNLKELVANIVKFVSFGLTNDGRFCAYIPENWNFLAFDTIIDPTSDFYGHLLMRY